MVRDDSLLPSFERPPLVEVVIGARFDELPRLQAPHLGLWWQALGTTEFPEFQSQPRLEPDLRPGQQLLRLRLGPELPRLWFMSGDGAWLNQVQSDHFLLNWRKLPDREYPRFPEVERQFQELWGKWLAFLSERALGSVERAQYQLTYVNHVPFDESLGRAEDVHRVLPHIGWSPEGKAVLVAQEDVRWEGVFECGDFGGRLNVQAYTGRSTMHGNKPALIIQLTAVGESTAEEATAWFQQARSAIVRGFCELTSEPYQKKWGRRDAGSAA